MQLDYVTVLFGRVKCVPNDREEQARILWQCLMALGSYGLGDTERAGKCYDAVLAIDCAHQGAILHKQLL